MVLLSVVHSRAAPPSALPLTRTRTPAPRTRRERRPSTAPRSRPARSRAPFFCLAEFRDSICPRNS